MSPKVPPKKIAAVAAAIAAYLQMEEQVFRAEPPAERAAVSPTFWGSSGRTEIMQMRMLWQRRIVSK